VQIDMGDLPSWLEAIGTVGSLAFLAGTYAGDRAGSRRDEERRQASLVDVWLGENNQVCGVNNSAGAVRDVRGRFEGDSDWRPLLAVLPPTGPKFQFFPRSGGSQRGPGGGCLHGQRRAALGAYRV
jgi:hypothetical protein